MSETMWDGSYPPRVYGVAVQGATAGTPGHWTPAQGYPIPATLAQANALGLSLGNAWDFGEFVVLDDVASSPVYWRGDAFVAGTAPDKPPVVSSITPATGPAAGGTAVTLTGEFQDAVAAALGATFLTAFVKVNDTTVTGTSAAHAAGTVDVGVRCAHGSWGYLTDGFTYTGAAEEPEEPEAARAAPTKSRAKAKRT